MKLKIKVKLFNPLCRLTILPQGDWIDLHAAETISMKGPLVSRSKKDSDRKIIFNDYKIPLGVAMELPKGYEAIINPRSSLFKKHGCMLVNSQGVIDNAFCGDNDQWFAHVVSFKNSLILEGERIMQFRIQLSQRATIWQKIKNLFYSGIELEIVEHLNNNDRGGHGSTGV